MNEKKTFLSRLKKSGPGLFMTACLIGPGSVTTFGLAGYNYGFKLSWTVLFAVIALITVQSMTGRIALKTKEGLAENIRNLMKESNVGIFVVVLIFVAILFGAMGYQAGNVTGAATGVSTIFGEHKVVTCIVISLIAGMLIMCGNIKIINNVLTGIVALMGITFAISAFIVKPDLGELIRGFIPSLPEGSTITAIGMVGTTLATYPVFLYASNILASRDKNETDIDEQIKDSMFGNVLGSILIGLISIAVMIVGFGLLKNGETVVAVSDLAKGLSPVAGKLATYIFALGLFGAGISSATAAPMGVTYVMAGLLGWSTDLKDKKFRVMVCISLVIGCIFAIMGGTPTTVILLAQAFNGVLLPLVVGVTIFVANKKNLLGQYTNKWYVNVFCAVVMMITIFLAYKSIVSFITNANTFIIGVIVAMIVVSVIATVVIVTMRANKKEDDTIMDKVG